VIRGSQIRVKFSKAKLRNDMKHVKYISVRIQDQLSIHQTTQPSTSMLLINGRCENDFLGKKIKIMFHVFEFSVFYPCCKYEIREGTSSSSPSPPGLGRSHKLQGELGAYMEETA